MKKWIFCGMVIVGLVCLAGCEKDSTTADNTTSLVLQEASVTTEESTPIETSPLPAVTEPSSIETTAPADPEPSSPTGWQEIDGKVFYLNDDGSLHIGWLEQEGVRYYFQEDGSMCTGWLELEGDRYYFHEDGIMAQGQVEISETEIRYFTSSGKEIILVNPWNMVPEDYSVELEKVYGYNVADECADDLKQMLKDCENDGHSAIIVSAYRTNEYQKGLFQRRIQRFVDEGYDREEAERLAAMRVARPGTSEHELGLAVDIVDSSYQNLNERQESTPAQQWLIEHCWEYGFVLRYPNSKSDVTGIIYEPWHYRYVGKELAKELYEAGLCLEEYLAALT